MHWLSLNSFHDLFLQHQVVQKKSLLGMSCILSITSPFPVPAAPTRINPLDGNRSDFSKEMSQCVICWGDLVPKNVVPSSPP
jgi:hypothetical protein